MSSILKALEKVEQSQSTRRSGSIGVARTRERRPAWILPVGILGGAAVAALATFAAMGGFSRQEAPHREAGRVASPPQAVAPLLERTAAVRNEVGRAPKPRELRQGEPQGAVLRRDKPAPAPAPKVAAKKGSDPLPKTAAHPAAARTGVAVQPGGTARGVPAAAARTPLRPSAGPVAAAAQEAAARPAPVLAATVAEESPRGGARRRPELKVTGIAWQNGSASSAAIVNGRSVEQGGVVDGYKVEQIHENKVTFSGNGGRFEIPLGAGE